MKILFCSPYGYGNNTVLGGISIWGSNILSYANSIDSEIKLKPISFDRHIFFGKNKNFFKRFFYGLTDLRISFRQAIHELEKGNYDIIHISSSASLSLLKDYLLIKSAKRNGVKSIIHFHFGRIPELYQKKNWEWKFIAFIMKVVDVAVTMDKFSYETLEQAGFTNVAYCPNPLTDSVLSYVDRRKDISAEPRKIVYVGHVVPTKGVYELVKACSWCDNICLEMVGKVQPDIQNKLLNLAKECNNTDWIEFTGEIHHEKVIEEILSSSIFVLPSYTEGFPNVVLEAMACSRPIIATSVGAIPEMLNINSHEPCGIVIPEKDVDALYSAILLLLNNPQMAKDLAINAYKRVRDTYAMDQVWKILELIWRDTVA